MKKLLILLLCILLATAMTSCGLQKALDRVDEMSGKSSNDTEDDSNNDEDTDTTEEDTDTTEENSDSDTTEEQTEGDQSDSSDGSALLGGGDFTDFKTALSTFITAYTELKTTQTDIMDKAPEYDSFIMDLLGVYTADLNIITVPFYDALDITGTNETKVMGQLMLSGYDAIKEKDGNLIRFGYDHEYTEDTAGYVTGDAINETGYFDTKKNFLQISDTLESGGSLAQRSVYELSMLPDGTFIMQTYSYDNRTVGLTGNAIFMRVEKNAFTYYAATFDPNLDFELNPLEGAGDVSLDQLATGTKVTFVIKVVNGKTTFEKK